jgi:hypothetical protein
MASTFSQTLRLELIGDGDQSGIWGQTTNTNLGTLLEQSITGVVSITMVDANYTLTNFNGVSDEARNAVLVVGGTNAAVRDIIAPLVEKLYVVRNSTAGGFAVNIRAASGSSVSVPSGATVWVYCDGTNFNAIGTESVGNFEVNGNLTVTGNTNAVAATYTGNVVALNYSTAGNVSATNFIGAGLTITSINASNISAGTIANSRTTAASANGASTIVSRDSDGSFAANVGTFVTVSGAHSGNGAGLTNINASNISSGTIANARTTAASANGASTIVVRDTNGSFAGNVITGTTGTFTSVSGNGIALTAINASNISSGTIANARTTAASANGASTIVARDSNGDFVANFVYATTFSGAGTGLTGTAASLNIGGTAATATSPASGGSFITSSNIGSQSVASATNSAQFQGKTKLGLGITGEGWNNNTGSKFFNTTYTNTSNYPVEICVTLSAGGTAQALIAVVNSGQILVNSDISFASVSFIVPPLTTYSVDCGTQSGNAYIWQELY